MSIIPPEFSLAHYRLTLTALETLHLPPYQGSALRGALGHSLKRLVCLQSQLCRPHCDLGNHCPYGYLFETAPPKETEVLRHANEIPRPFILEPPLEQRLLRIPGESLVFGLTLIGRGIDYLPYFVAVFREMGQAGLGRGRGRFRLQTVETLGPDREPLETIYQAEVDRVRTPATRIDGAALTARAAALPTGRLALDFLTPARLKYQGRWVTSGPPFAVLVRALFNRIASLSYFHCGRRLELDFKGLIDRAEAVTLAETQTRWEDWSRFSGRQKRRIELGGLLGRAIYTGPLEPYLPLLALGEQVHVGKGTVFGNGRYTLTPELP